MNIIEFIKAAHELSEKRDKEKKLLNQKKQIADLFNDLYEYKYDYYSEGINLKGFSRLNKNAYMCTQCLKINRPYEFCVFGGLLYKCDHKK